MLTERIKTALERVRASERLKTDTARFLVNQINARKKARVLPRALAAFTALAAIFVAFSVYFTAFAYVDLDVNPSIELTLNRLGRVIAVRAYNDGGQSALGKLSLTHKTGAQALDLLFSAMTEQGFLQSGALVSVTLQTDDQAGQPALLDGLRASVEQAAARHCGGAQTEVFAVSREIRQCSHELDVSPAKYLAIIELIEADPTATVEGCRGHSVSEIRQMARGHGGKNGGHHGH